MSRRLAHPRPLTDREQVAVRNRRSRRRINKRTRLSHAHPRKTRTLIIGIGHDHRHDDALGLVAARRLRARKLPGVTILEATGEGAALMKLWQNAHTVILLDAVQSGAAPGTLHRLDARKQPVRIRFFPCSTHAFGVAEAVELSRALGQLPPRLIILGLEARWFTQGDGLSPEVRRAIPVLLNTVTRELKSP
ncbi:MAG: hydrogenase maturation protease [Verrucomicrobiae bacterium]|nr:hydrogenase maturation protease [Verrucomicrobiae bacterium]